MSFPRYPEYKDSGVEWLGAVPRHWDIKRLKHLADIQNGRDYKEVESDEGYPVIGSGGPFSFASRFIYQGESVLLGRKGTIDRPLYVNGAFWAVDTMFYTVIKPRVNAKFLYYCTLTIRFDRYSTSTALPSMTQSDLNNIEFAVPCYEEQCSITAFLEREITKIDNLMAEQEKLIALLKEKRQTVISHAVTKGLDPTAPMKDSGVEWLGEVPAHWEVSQLKYVARDGTSITYGIVQAGPHIEGGIPYIKTSDMSGESLPLEGYSRTSREIDQSYSRSKVFFGDLVIAIRASVGKCLPLPEELDGANLTQGTAKISPGECVERDYLLNLINSTGLQVYFDSMAKGATFKEITLDMLRRTPVLIAPLAEQRDIARYLATELKSFQNLLQETEKAISLLKERRTALISAAVTGQIDVRGLVKEEQEQAV